MTHGDIHELRERVQNIGGEFGEVSDEKVGACTAGLIG